MYISFLLERRRNRIFYLLSEVLKMPPSSSIGVKTRNTYFVLIFLFNKLRFSFIAADYFFDYSICHISQRVFYEKLAFYIFIIYHIYIKKRKKLGRAIKKLINYALSASKRNEFIKRICINSAYDVSIPYFFSSPKRLFFPLRFARY